MTDLTVPKHIGYIVDGNRRWAKKHGLPAYEGHLAGYNVLKDIVIDTINAGVEYVSVYIFSTENWKRSEEEVSKLMGLVLKLLTSDLPILDDNNIKLLVLGSRDRLSDRIIKAIDEAELRTVGNTAGTLALCFNYGGQLEIVDAVKKIIESGVPADAVTADLVSQNLYAPEVPPLDLVVRTSGEQRLSNFMLWRVAYSEIMFIEKTWPDITKDEIANIISDFSKRSRRFGG
ncbi:MAG: polyprenyl diphosphate synthase [Candidatus Saccharibacteria bacterium]